MLNSKPVSVNKHDPIGPVRDIVSKSVANLRNISSRKTQSVVNSAGQQQMITVTTNYHAVQRGFEGGHKVQNWLEAASDTDNG